MFDTTRIRGVIPAMVTPLTPDGEPDERGLRSHIRFLLGEGKLKELGELKASGVLTEAEFEVQKDKILHP